MLQERHTHRKVPALREELRKRLGGLHHDELTDTKLARRNHLIETDGHTGNRRCHRWQARGRRI